VPSATSPRGSPAPEGTDYEHSDHRHRQRHPQPAAVPYPQRHPGREPHSRGEPRRQVEGEWVDGATTYWEIVCFGTQAENIIGSLTRGTRAIAVGSPRTRAWTTSEGEDRSVLEIVADEIGPSLRWAITEVTRVTAS
jgi:hypothetical protein